MLHLGMIIRFVLNRRSIQVYAPALLLLFCVVSLPVATVRTYLPQSSKENTNEKKQILLALVAHGWAPRHTAPAFRSASPSRETWHQQPPGPATQARPVFPADGLPRHSVLLDLPPPSQRTSRPRSGESGKKPSRCFAFFAYLLVAS